MADTKGNSMIWRMNNRKIEKIKQHEQENVKMNDMLDNLKAILRKWSNQYNQETPTEQEDQKIGQIGLQKQQNSASIVGSNNKSSFKEDFPKQPT